MIISFQSLSALDNKITHDFTKLYSLLVFSYADDLSAAAKKMAKASQPNAEKFIDNFKLDKRAFKKAIEFLNRGRNPSDDPDMHAELQKFSKSMREKMVKIDAERDIDHQYIKLFKDMNTVCNSISEAAFNRIIKNISVLNEPEIARLYEADVGDQTDILGQLKKLVKKMTGKTDTEIDSDTRAEYKGSTELKEYNKLRRELNAVPKNFVANYVRQSGKALLPINEVKTALTKAGIKHHSIPNGFKGLMDDQMNYFTLQGKQLLQAPAGEVIMNPKYDPKQDNAYVCTSQPPFAAKPTRIYTVDYRKGKNVAKFDVAQVLARDIEKYRKVWLKDLKTNYNDENVYIAHLVELIYHTSARVGNRNNASSGSATYGLTTLLRSHLTARGDTRTFAYAGKKAQKQKHIIKGNDPVTRKLIKFIDANAEGKAKKDLLFDFNGNSITSVKINNYLRGRIGLPEKATVHKFRTARGTHMASVILKGHPFKKAKEVPTQKAVNDWLKSAFETIADRLGHYSNEKLTITTAIQNYIDPSLMEEFFHELKIRPPAQIQRAIDSAKI